MLEFYENRICCLSGPGDTCEHEYATSSHTSTTMADPTSSSQNFHRLHMRAGEGGRQSGGTLTGSSPDYGGLYRNTRHRRVVVISSAMNGRGLARDFSGRHHQQKV
jgi:hypothetical protein